MILLHQEEVDLLKTVILFPRLLPNPPLHLERRRGADALREVPLDALKTYIMHCFGPAAVFCGLLAHSGAGLSARRVSGWAAGEGSLRGVVDAGIPNRR